LKAVWKRPSSKNAESVETTKHAKRREMAVFLFDHFFVYFACFVVKKGFFTSLFERCEKPEA